MSARKGKGEGSSGGAPGAELSKRPPLLEEDNSGFGSRKGYATDEFNSVAIASK